MSSLRQGVLRAVRLLPNVVKIGVEPETALPSIQEEEQLLNGTSVSDPKREELFTPENPDKKWKDKIAELQENLTGSELARLQLANKIASLEEELAKVKETAVRKEHELTASVETQKEQARVEGYAQGHAEGLENGHKAGLENARLEAASQYHEKFSILAGLLEGMSTRLEENFAELTSLNQPRMLRLWQEMLKKMLQREMSLTPDAVVNVLADVLSRLSDKNHILIYVSPEDMELLQDKMQGEFEDVLRGVKHLELKPDTNVDKGSCLVETNLGVYDARWRTQLEQIDTAVEKLFQKLGKTPKAKTTRAIKQRPEKKTEKKTEPDETGAGTTAKASSRKKKTEKIDASD